MMFMPGTTLKDLDETDIGTLLPWYFWKVNKEFDGQSSEKIVYREGQPYKVISANNASWLKDAF